MQIERTINMNRAIFLFVLAWAFLLSGSACRKNHVSAPLPSPSGLYSVVSRVNREDEESKTFLYVVLEIRDKSGSILQSFQTRASDRMKWKIAWDKQDRLWLDSSDIGTYYWEPPSWAELSYADMKKKDKDVVPPF